MISNDKNNVEKSLYEIFIESLKLMISGILSENFFNFFADANSNKLILNSNILIDNSICFIEGLIFNIYHSVGKYGNIINNRNIEMKNPEKNNRSNSIEFNEAKLKKDKLDNLLNKLINEYNIKFIIGGIINLINKKKLETKLKNSKQILETLIITLNQYNNINNSPSNVNASEDDETICQICLTYKCDCHIRTCGHTFCFYCVQQFRNVVCPICRETMNGIIEYPYFNFNVYNQLNNN